jgi:hypothetical protein
MVRSDDGGVSFFDIPGVLHLSLRVVLMKLLAHGLALRIAKTLIQGGEMRVVTKRVADRMSGGWLVT